MEEENANTNYPVEEEANKNFEAKKVQVDDADDSRRNSGKRSRSPSDDKSRESMSLRDRSPSNAGAEDSYSSRDRGRENRRHSYRDYGRDGYREYERDDNFRDRQDYRDVGSGRGRGGRGRFSRYDDRVERGSHRSDEFGRQHKKTIEPMESYKQFMMRQDENQPPEVYLTRYEEYKKKYTQRVMRSFFEEHKKEEWLQTRYSPLVSSQKQKDKTKFQIQSAYRFAERVKSGEVKICLDDQSRREESKRKRENGSDDDSPEEGQDIDAEGKEVGLEKENEEKETQHDVVYCNDMEDTSRILYVRRVPCYCPESILRSQIQQGGDFQEIYLSDPAKKPHCDFDMSAWIVYADAEQAKKALERLQNKFFTDDALPSPVRLQVYAHRPRANLNTPTCASVPLRVEFDFEQAKKIAARMDDIMLEGQSETDGVGILSLLEAPEVEENYPSIKRKLDLIISYLRRVHYYIYYTGTQFLSMGDIFHMAPALFCRPPATEKDIEEDKENAEKCSTEEGVNHKRWTSWGISLDAKHMKLLQSLEPTQLQNEKEKKEKLIEEIQKKEEGILEKMFDSYVVPSGDDGKQRCNLCKKLFKAAEYVKKHIRNKHPELVTDQAASCSEDVMWEEYQNDENRPIPSTSSSQAPILGDYRRDNRRDPPTLPRGRGGYSRGGSLIGHRGHPFGPRGGGNVYEYNGGYDHGGYDNRPMRYDSGRGRGRGRGRFEARRQSYSQGLLSRPAPDHPSDPREVNTGYRELDDLKDTEVQFDFSALANLPPPKKKQRND